MSTLDVSMALRNLNGNEQLYNKLLRRFADSNTKAGQDIRAALDAGDDTTALRLAHTLKGLAASLGAPALSAEALAVEQKIKDNGALPADGLDALEAELAQMIAAINARLG